MPPLTAWDATLRLVATEARIRRSFKPGFVLDDELLGLTTTTSGHRAVVYLHGVACHELTHLDGRMGKGHSEEFVSAREDLGHATGHLLPAIAVLGLAPRGSRSRRLERRRSGVQKLGRKGGQKVVLVDSSGTSSEALVLPAGSSSCYQNGMSAKLEIYLKGGRFDEAAGFPLDSLPALRAVGDLVESVARDLFFAENPERKRVPAGFDATFTPALTRLQGGGSAECDIGGWSRVKPELSNYFDDAQSETFSLLQALLADEVAFPAWCSRKTRKHLATVLSAVTDQETMKLSVEANGVAPDPVTLGVEHRQRAKAAARAVAPTLEEEFSIAGRIYAIENDPWAIGIKVREGGHKLRVAIADDQRDRARAEFDADEKHLILVQGVAERDDDSGSRTFILAKSIKGIAGPAIGERLGELSGLTDGWLDEDENSRAPTKALCRWVERQLWGAIEDHGWDRPHIFATSTGGIDAVWRRELHTIRATFTSQPLEVRCRAIHLDAKRSQLSDSSRSLSTLVGWAERALEGAG